MPLSRFRPLEALYAGSFAVHRVHRVVRARPVSVLGADPSLPTVPRCEMLLVHSSVRSFLLRVPSLLLPLDTFRCRALPTRVWSLFAASSGPSTRHERSHSPATFRPQVFSTSRRFAPAPTSRACSIPQPRPGFIPSRGFSLRAATFPRREELPPCRCPLRAHHPEEQLPRSASSTTRLCSTRRCVAPVR
jgi:hypothetical protein